MSIFITPEQAGVLLQTNETGELQEKLEQAEMMGYSVELDSEEVKVAISVAYCGWCLEPDRDVAEELKQLWYHLDDEYNHFYEEPYHE